MILANCIVYFLINNSLLSAEINDQNIALPGGFEPPTFRLTVERANRLRHRDSTSTPDLDCLLVMTGACSINLALYRITDNLLYCWYGDEQLTQIACQAEHMLKGLYIF